MNKQLRVYALQHVIILLFVSKKVLFIFLYSCYVTYPFTSDSLWRAKLRNCYS